MKGKIIFFRLFVLFLLGSAVPCSAYVFSIVVDRKKADYDKTISAIEQAVKEGHEIKLFELNKNDMSNPIQRGQFLSQIAAGDWLLPSATAHRNSSPASWTSPTFSLSAPDI